MSAGDENGLLNKECEIGLLIEQEMYNLLSENYAEYFIFSWIFTYMGISMYADLYM
jgi:hypothetical protein